MQASEGKPVAQEQKYDYWFPKDTLGVLEQTIASMLNNSSKRSRAVEFRAVERVLKGLKLISSKCHVTRLGLGCNKLGELGLMVSVLMPTQVRGAQLPETAQEKGQV